MTTQSRALRGVGPLVTAYAVVTVLLTTVVSWAQGLPLAAEITNRSQIVTGDPIWIDAWVRWDSNWYGGIAENGYFYHPGQQSPIAFFPSYPMAVRLVAELVGDVQVAGVLVTVLCGAASLVLFWRWLDGRVTSRARRLATASLMAYPYAFFIYGAMYSDALFLLCVLAAFTALEARHFALAGLIGAVATAGRPVGLALVAGLVVRTLEMLAQSTSGRDKVSFRELVRALTTVRPRHTLVGLSVAGLLGWMAYLWFVFGNPVAFADAQSSPGWDRVPDHERGSRSASAGRCCTDRGTSRRSSSRSSSSACWPSSRSPRCSGVSGGVTSPMPSSCSAYPWWAARTSWGVAAT